MHVGSLGYSMINCNHHCACLCFEVLNSIYTTNNDKGIRQKMLYKDINDEKFVIL